MSTSDITTENERIAREFGGTLWEERYDALRELCAPDARFHDPAFGPEGTDLDGIIEHFEQIHESMSDATNEVLDVVASGDSVGYRGRVSATHTGEFMGIDPTEKRVSVDDHIFLRIVDGEITETWAQYDMMGLLQQLGAKFPGAARR